MITTLFKMVIILPQSYTFTDFGNIIFTRWQYNENMAFFNTIRTFFKYIIYIYNIISDGFKL